MADSGAGLFRSLDVVGRIPADLRAQTGCRAPLVGTNGGAPVFMKFPYFLERARKGGFEAPIHSTRAKLSRIRNQSSRRR